MPEYECIVNPHDAVGRTRSPATGRTVAAIVVTVIALSALACLAFPIGQGAAPTALAAAQAAHPPVRVTSAMQHRLAAARPAQGVSSKRFTTAEQHLAIAKQALEEAPAEEAPAQEAPAEEPAAEETPEEKAPEEEAPAEEAPVAEPAADSAADGDAGGLAGEGEKQLEDFGGELGFNLEHKEDCKHKLKNGKCAPHLAPDVDLPPWASILLILFVSIPALAMVVVWAREPVGLEGLMSAYEYKTQGEEMTAKM